MGIPQGLIEKIEGKVREKYHHLKPDVRKEIYREISKITTNILNGQKNRRYNIHKLMTVPPRLSGVPQDEKLMEADARTLNRATNQKDGGTERYLFNEDGIPLGIAYHPNSDTKKLKWRTKFDKR